MKNHFFTLVCKENEITALRMEIPKAYDGRFTPIKRCVFDVSAEAFARSVSSCGRSGECEYSLARHRISYTGDSAPDRNVPPLKPYTQGFGRCVFMGKRESKNNVNFLLYIGGLKNEISYYQ